MRQFCWKRWAYRSPRVARDKEKVGNGMACEGMVGRPCLLDYIELAVNETGGKYLVYDEGELAFVGYDDGAVAIAAEVGTQLSVEVTVAARFVEAVFGRQGCDLCFQRLRLQRLR